MNYERISKLARMLNEHHGEADRHGFVVAPENERMLAEHKQALEHAGRLFDYRLIGTERLGILSVTRKEAADGHTYVHVKLEHLPHDAFAAHKEIAQMLQEYMEYKKSQITEY